MGSFGGFLGTSGGAQGTGFGGPMAGPQDPTGNTNLWTTFNQLQGVANGTGPNPAMAQYNQNVQDLAKQQSGAIGSIQGISPALAARMASQQGSGAMQNAAAQGATMQAQQQLGAMGQMGNVAGQQAGIAAGMQQNVNNANAGLAGGVMGQQSTVIGGMMNGASKAMGMMAGGAAQGGMAGRDFANPKMMAGGGEVAPMSQFAQFLSSSVPQPGPVVSQSFTMPSTVADTSGDGVVPPSPSSPKGTENPGIGPESKSAGSPSMYTEGNYGENAMNMNTGPSITSEHYAQDLMNRDSGMPPAQEHGLGFGTAPAFAGGGKVQAMLSPGETYIPPGKVSQAANSPNPLAAGRRIPGNPKVAGNSYANDTSPQTLKEGGIVIPNAVMQSPNPAMAAHDFIAGIIAKHRGRK